MKTQAQLLSEFMQRVLEGRDPTAPAPEPGTPEYEAFVKDVEASALIMDKELDELEEQ